MKIKLNIKIITYLIIYINVCTSSFAATIYVDQISGNDANNGLTPNNAVATITRGSALISDGDTINIGPGTFSVSSGEVFPLVLDSITAIQGAGADITILDAEETSQILRVNSSQSVSIDGLTFINGSGGFGGGMLVEAQELTLTNCKFENNSGVGGGATVIETPAVFVDNCDFIENSSSSSGGLQIRMVDDVDMVAHVTRSKFINTNQGGIVFGGSGTGIHNLSIDQSSFFNSQSRGVLYLSESGTSVGQITNSLFVGHSIAVWATDSILDIVNVTIIDSNTGARVGAQSTIVNSIFWDNLTEIRGDDATVSFSIVQDLDLDNHIDGGDNFDLDPLLDIDYRLTEASPAIDRGSDQAVDNLNLTQDIDQNQRKINYSNLNRPEGVVDIGAHEISDIIFEDGFEI